MPPGAREARRPRAAAPPRPAHPSPGRPSGAPAREVTARVIRNAAPTSRSRSACSAASASSSVCPGSTAVRRVTTPARARGGAAVCRRSKGRAALGASQWARAARGVANTRTPAPNAPARASGASADRPGRAAAPIARAASTVLPLKPLTCLFGVLTSALAWLLLHDSTSAGVDDGLPAHQPHPTPTLLHSCAVSTLTRRVTR